MKKMTTKDNAGRMSTNYPLLDSYLTLTCPLHAYRSIVYFFAVFAMLLLGGWNTQAWAWRGARIKIYSEPENGGYVYANTSNSGSASNKTNDYAEKSENKLGKTTYYFYLFNAPKSGYTFKGYSTSQTANSGTTNTNQFGIECNTSLWIYTEKTYYAIFARLTRDKSSLSFGDRNSQSGWGNAQTVQVTYVHAGKVEAKISGTNADEFSFANNAHSTSKTLANNNTNSEENTTITVYFNPQCDGTRTATLTISSSNGLASQTVSLSGKGVLNSQTLSWDNESSIEENMLVNTTQPLSVTNTSGLEVTYTSSDNDIIRRNSDGNLEARSVGTATITASCAATCKYSAATSITKTFKVKSKDTPIFKPNGFSEGSTYSMKVGDKVTLEVEHVSAGLAGDFKAVSTQANGLNVLSFTREGNIVTIEAINAGNTTATFTQTENSAILGATKSYNFSVSKHETSFSGQAYNFMVDGDVIANYTYTNVSATLPSASSSDDFYYTIDDVVFTNSAKNNGNNLVTFEPSTKRITACNAGTAKITLHQKETYKYTGATVSFNVAVYKYNSVFSGVADMSVNVDESKTSGYVLTYTKPDANYIGAANHTAGTPTQNDGEWCYTLAQTVTSSNTQGSAYPANSVEYVAKDKKVTGENEGTATIHLYQKETYKYNPADTEFDIEISKNVPVFTWQNGPYYHNSTVKDIFSTTGESSYFIGVSSDTLVAKVSGNTLYVLSKNGKADFVVTQQENYKWKFHQETYSVEPKVQDNHVTFTYTQAMYNDGSITTSKVSSSWDNSNQVHLEGGAFNWDDKYIVIHFSGIPDKVSFKYKASSGAATGADWYVKESNNGSSWSDVWTNESNSTSWATVSNKQLATTTRYLKFCYSGNFDGYFKDIKVTELQRFNGYPTELNLGEWDINAESESKTFDFNYANAGHHVTLSVDDDHFTVSPSVITNVGGEKVGKEVITVSYKTTEIHKNNNAKLTISDELGHSATVTLKGETHKLTPTVTWIPDETTFNVDDVLTAINANEFDVTLSVEAEDASYIECSGNAAVMLASKSGTVMVTAHVTGNDIYADADITKEITITNKTKQYITWEQDFSRLKINDATKSITLNATSSSGLPVTYELQGDKTGVSLTQNGNTWTLTYSDTECKNTTIVAKQAGNDDYAPASKVTLSVKVIDPTKECDGLVAPLSDKELRNTSFTVNVDIPQEVTIHVKRSNTEWYAAYALGFDVEFYDGKNGTGNKVGDTHSYGASDINNSKTMNFTNLDRNIKSVKLISHAILYGYTVTELTYKQHRYCELSTNALSFETYPNTKTSEKTFYVNHANYPISLECNNSKFSFSPEYFGDCLLHGKQKVSVTYTAGPDEGTDNGILYIKDNTGKTLGTVTLSVSITQVDQSIKSHNIQQAYKTTELVTLTAETNSGLSDFTFTATPSDIVTVNGNKLTFSKSGTISVTVSEPGSNVYRPTSTTVNNIVVSKDEPYIATAPTGTSIQYLQTFRSSILSGGLAEVTFRGVEHRAVEGTFAWTNPDYQVKEKAVANNYSVTFTPTNGDMYTAKEFTIPVTILRAPQSIEMNDGEVQVRVLGLNDSSIDSKIDLSSLIAKKTADPFETAEKPRAGAITYEVISENKANASISGNEFSASVCGEYTIRATQLQTDYYEAATDEFVITVNRLTPVVSNESNKTLRVDVTQDNAFTILGGQDLIPHITIKSISDINNGDGQVIEYDPVNNRIIAHNAGEAEIYLEQKQTNTIAAYNSPVYTYKVIKYSNTINNSWIIWSKNANFDEEVEVSFTTYNTDYANSPLRVEASAADSLIAIMTADDDTHFTMRALYNVGTSTWHVSQPESYKYNKAEHDIKLTVQASTTSCLIFNEPNEHSFFTDLNDFSGHFEVGDDAFPVNGPVDRIYFKAKTQSGAVNTGLISGEYLYVVQYSVDNGANWRTLGALNANSEWKDFSFDFSDLQANEKVSHIRFGARTGSTLTKYYKDIRITRKTWLQPIDAENATIDTLRVPDNTIGSFTTAKFYVDFSTCDDVIKLASDNEHFTLSTNAIAAEGDNQGNATEVIVTYRNTIETADTATLTLYTNSQHTTFTVVGKTYKKQQYIEWQEGFTERPLILPAGTVADNTNIAAKTTRPDGTVVYTTDNPEVIEIILNGMGFKIVGNGEAKLSASSAGNDEWYPVSDTITISTSSKLMQEIVWEQSFKNAGLEIGQDTVLEAKVYIRQPNGELVFNQECTDRIVYKYPEYPANNSVISLNENVMTIVGYGKTTVTASVEGTDNYIEAKSVTLTVKIGKLEEGCVTPFVLDYKDVVKLESTKIDLSHFTTPQVTAVLEIDATKGTPDLLSFSYNGQNYLVNQCSGTIKVQQRINGVWYDIENWSFTNKEAFDWQDKDSLQLNENANAIQFVRLDGGIGTHNFKDITITLKHYFHPTEEIINLEEINIGQKINKSVGIDFSDVKSELQVWKKSTDDPTLTFNDNDIDTIPCGAHGHFDLPITILPSKLGEWKDTLLVADTITKDTISIIVKAYVTPGNQYVFIEEGPWVWEEKWQDDKKPGAENSVLITADVFIPDTANITINAMTIQEDVTVTVYGILNLVGPDNSLTFDNYNYGNLHVAAGGKVNVGSGALLVNDFILDASLGNKDKSGSSGQVEITNPQTFFVRGDAYFDLALDPSGACSYGWYDFTVPFPVNAANGVSRFDNSTHKEKSIKCETNYAIMDYSESRHLETGYGWKKYHSVMQPGQCYTITIDSYDNVYRFKKTKDGAINTKTTETLAYTDSESDDRGWNGLGNGTLTYVNLAAAGIEKVQVYDHATNTFSVKGINEYTYVVGSAFMVQTPSAGKEISYVRQEENTLHTLRAPQRTRTIEEFRLALTAEGAEKESDRLYVGVSEEATDSYVIGRDLYKFGEPTEAKIAQIWAKAYGHKLCDIEMPLNGDGARCELGLFAPKESSYTLSVEKAPEDVTLYLTFNDRPIWNLSMSPYVLDLTNGTTEGYGLQLYVRTAPEVATGVDEVQGDNVPCTKVLMDGKMYIITPEGAIFDATGKKVK